MLRVTFDEVWRAGWEFLLKTFTHDWLQKVMLTPPIVFYSRALGGDWHILLWFYAAFTLDLFAGLASAIKRREFSRKKLELWVVKLLVYTLCIYLTGIVDQAFYRALPVFHVPILDILVCVLLVAEVVSIFTNLEELTGRVPPELMRVAEKLRHKAGRRLENMLDDHGPGGKND